MKTADIIAERQLVVNQTVGRVILYRPERLSNGDFECRYAFENLPLIPTASGKGVDGIQALLVALELIRTDLKQRDNVHWQYAEDGLSAGFPLIVLAATAFGERFARRIEQVLENELQRHLAERSGSDL